MATSQTPGVAAVPSTDHLQRDEILKSMLAFLPDHDRKFDTVDLKELKSSVLQRVLDAADESKPDVNFSAGDQLRGFLKAFQGTKAYEKQFNVLDARTQDQIRAFGDVPDKWRETPIWQDTKENGFRMPETNPEVAQPLGASSVSHPNFITKFILRTFMKLVRRFVLLSLKFRMRRAARKLEDAEAKKYIGGPKIYEDEKNKDEISVSVFLTPNKSSSN